jgi:predicted N-formylglutamate amidohydrolase
VLYTCEHASAQVPPNLQRDARTDELLAMHWGSDLGAAWLTEALATESGCAAILGTVSRLVIDLNRDPDDATAFLYDTHEGLVAFNADLGPNERARRIDAYFTPYHAAIARCLTTNRPRFLISIHSFTPEYRGQRRSVEAGVLFDQHDDIAHRWVEELCREGFRAEPNEPYSGKAGLIYSPARHGRAFNVPYLELEVRQDLLATPELAREVAERVRAAMARTEGL